MLNKLQQILLSLFVLVLLAACSERVPLAGIKPENTPAVHVGGTVVSAATAVPTETAVSTVTQTPIPAMEDEPTATPAPTETPLPPTPTPTPELPETYIGIWIGKEELAQLPMEGSAWENVVAVANERGGDPNISDQNNDNDVRVLAKALVYARTGDTAYRDEVIENLMAAIDTEDGGRTLALGRNLVSYVIAADLINLPQNPEENDTFSAWLRETLTEELGDLTLQTTHELRPNNWGTHAGASRAAVALYLGDMAELEQTAQVFKGWLGDRDTYDSFEFGEDWWQADEDNPVAINPVGTEIDGHSVDGAQPEEMRRGGKFKWPPKETGYPWEALQGSLVQAEILSRAGYDTWEWEEQALLRAVRFLYEIEWPADGDDQWQLWMINHVYGTDYAAETPARTGKNIGFTDWTHSVHRIIMSAQMPAEEQDS
ncbi:MAG: alginate lyase family protein [Chloroflexota bacterium]